MQYALVPFQKNITFRASTLNLYFKNSFLPQQGTSNLGKIDSLPLACANVEDLFFHVPLIWRCVGTPSRHDKDNNSKNEAIKPLPKLNQQKMTMKK